MSEPRRHHLLPEFYLKGFTDTGTSAGLLKVFDYQRAKCYRVRPSQVGLERDFYRVDEPGRDPFEIEKSLADIESELAPPLALVLTTGIFHGGHHLGEVLSLVALVHVRGRWGRARIIASSQETMRQKLAAETVTRQQWEQLWGAHARDGLDPSKIPDLERATELANFGWKPPVPKAIQAGFLAEIQRECIEALADHSWALAKAGVGTGGFICSETPLAWGTDPDQPAKLQDLSTHVTFPLSRHYALFSRPEDKKRGTFAASREMVAWINGRTHSHAMGTVYCAEEDYLISGRIGMGRGSGLFRYLTKDGTEGVPRPRYP